MCFRRYGNLKVSLDYNGKSEVDLFFHLIADILTNFFTEMFLE